MTRESAIQFLRFGATGAIGFSADAAALYSLIMLGVDPYLARVFSFAFAVSITWTINRAWTFQKQNAKRLKNRLWRYLAVQILAVLFNYSIYASLLTLFGPTPVNAVFALAIASCVSLFINYAGVRALVFNTAPKPDAY